MSEQDHRAIAVQDDTALAVPLHGIRQGTALGVPPGRLPQGPFHDRGRPERPRCSALELWDVNVEVHRRGLELIKPGAVCKDIAAELNEIYIGHGLLPNRTFGYGHSFGVLSHYYGREAGLELREDIDTVLEPGTVSMEPMITVLDGEPGAGGYREHDILVVGEDGAENITKFPFGPEHNIIPC
jgi:creatinase